MDKYQNRMADEDYQAIKVVLRENGYVPNTKLIYEMHDKMQRALSCLRFGRIDEMCHEDYLRKLDRLHERNRVEQKIAEYLAESRY
jgi:hypothetical protein